MDSYDRGDFADLQWAYRAAENADETLFALVERRVSSIVEMEWTTKLADKKLPWFDASLAAEQQAALNEHYGQLDNLYEAIDHISMSIFRGFSICEIQPQNKRLEPVDHWNVVRDGRSGAWKYNPDALQASFSSLPDANLITPDNFIIHCERRGHIDRLGLIKYCRYALGVKDWTAFIEIYGIPKGIVIMPNNIPAGKESEYEQAAELIASGSPGALPFGSDYKPNDAPRGTDPFTAYLTRLDQQIVLAGTGGMLTMLAQSGSGTLAGSAHAETFRQLARAHGRRISETMQRQIDKRILASEFPDKPILAYFTLEFLSPPSVDQVVEHASKLSSAGYKMDPAELSERTGYRLEAKEEPSKDPNNPAKDDNSDDPKPGDAKEDTDTTGGS